MKSRGNAHFPHFLHQLIRRTPNRILIVFYWKFYLNEPPKFNKFRFPSLFLHSLNCKKKSWEKWTECKFAINLIELRHFSTSCKPDESSLSKMLLFKYSKHIHFIHPFFRLRHWMKSDSIARYRLFNVRRADKAKRKIILIAFGKCELYQQWIMKIFSMENFFLSTPLYTMENHFNGKVCLSITYSKYFSFHHESKKKTREWESWVSA